jgi:hypothetical protein
VLISSLASRYRCRSGKRGLPVHGLYREVEPGYSLFGSVDLLKTDALFFDPKPWDRFLKFKDSGPFKIT